MTKNVNNYDRSFVQRTLLLLLPLYTFATPVKTMEDKSAVTQIIHKIKELNDINSFVAIPLNLSEEEQLAISNLQIKLDANYDRFGNLSLLEEELPKFLHSLGNNNELTMQLVTKAIYRIVDNITKACNKETAWVSVRAFLPNELYDIPRWHMDGYYYKPYSGLTVKFAATLKGSATLFYRASPEVREQFNILQHDRIALHKLLNSTMIESPQKEYGVLFIVGNHHHAAIHSEPAIKEKRLFFSVLPGNTSEINELYCRWHSSSIFTIKRIHSTAGILITLALGGLLWYKYKKD